MTRLSVRAVALAAATCVAALGYASRAEAQMCATCPTPTVAFSPVVATPAQVVVAPRLGLFDRWRLRRWGIAAPATTVAVAPMTATTWTAGFAPVATPTAWTAGFAPVATPTTWTANFAPVATPHLTAFAPLQRPVAQTAFMVAAPSTSCSPCATTVLSPVVAAPACSACEMAAPCSGCAATSAGYVDQASYAAPSSGCSSCAASDGSVLYSTPAGSMSDPPTPQPQLDVPAPTGSGYTPVAPEPEADGGATDTSFEAPGLIGPGYNSTARGPSVDVHTAVYRRPATAANVSTANRPASRVAVDAGEWTATGSR